MKPRQRQTLRLACAYVAAIAGCLSPALARAQEGVVALRGARLLTITGGVVEGGTLLFQGGRILAVGADVGIPAGATVLDLPGMTVMPGLIDASTNLGLADYLSLGMDDNEATDPMTPQLRVVDALNPQNRFLATARPFCRRKSTAFSMSPWVSWRAALQSIIPALVFSRSSFTMAEVICNVVPPSQSLIQLPD